MAYKSLAAVVLAAAALAVYVTPAGAGDDLVRLGGGSATTLALGTDIQANTVAVGRGHGGGFHGGGFHGGGFHGGGFHGGGFHGGGFRSVGFHGGGFYRAGWGGRFYGGYYRPYFYAPRYYSFYRPYGYWGGYGGGYGGYPCLGLGLGYYQPYCSYLYTSPLYYSYSAYYPISTTYYPLGTTVISPPATVLDSVPSLPVPNTSGYTPATPPMPPAQPGTFSYDGGPSNPVPLPRREAAPPPPPPPAPAPMSVPPKVQGDDRLIALPRTAPKYRYPAYGDSQKKPALNYGRDLQVSYPSAGKDGK
jgi:hypothetical protein